MGCKFKDGTMCTRKNSECTGCGIGKAFERKEQLSQMTPAERHYQSDTNIIAAWRLAEPFNTTDLESLPGVPKLWFSGRYQEELIPEIIRRGGIPKKDLIPGRTYYGSCRNASEALWNGEVFIYQRTKWGSTYSEEINHFEDDDGYDLFLPVAIKPLEVV